MCVLNKQRLSRYKPEGRKTAGRSSQAIFILIMCPNQNMNDGKLCFSRRAPEGREDRRPQLCAGPGQRRQRR